MSKEKLLKYISENEHVIVEAIGGPYIEIDLIPNSHDGLHSLVEILESCNKLNIDIEMITRSYPPTNAGDGIRMGRYMYFMQETTKEILKDLKSSKLS